MGEVADRRRKRAVALINWLKAAPCVDCDVAYPSWNMHFDHKRDKIRNVSRMRNSSLKAILDEIEKCDLVCANCHGTRSQLRLFLEGKTIIHDEISDIVMRAEQLLCDDGEDGGEPL